MIYKILSEKNLTTRIQAFLVLNWYPARRKAYIFKIVTNSGMKHTVRVLPLLLIVLSSWPIAEGKDQSAARFTGDPHIIDLLYISRGLFQGSVVDKMLAADPSIEVLGVPMPGHYSISDLGKDPEMMNRIMRIYMPRSYQHLLDQRDMVILHEAPCGSTQFPQVQFDSKWIFWFVKFVKEDGRPLEMWGGDASWGGGEEGWYRSWGETPLDEILPYTSLGGYNPSYAGAFKPHFFDPDHPLARLPWKRAGPIELLNKVEPKIGAQQIAEAVGPNVHYPWIATWRPGKGKVVGETQVFGSMGTTNRMFNDWRWYQDFMIYLVYFGADKPIPEDIYRAHRLREEINTHLEKASMLVSLLDFVEKFGASTVRLYKDLEAINKREQEAEEYYRMDDYDSAAQVFEEINKAWTDLNSKAIQVKKKALVWVYIIEWFSVTGVAMIAGVFLWVAMVKRRFYAEVSTTRTFS